MSDGPRTVPAPSPTRRASGWLRRCVAVLAPLATAVGFAVAWRDWGSAYATTMAKTIQLEFLVIHAAVFLGVFILLPIESRLFRSLRWVAVALLALMYCSGAYSLLGWIGVISLAAIFIGTYGGFIVAQFSPSAGATSVGLRAGEIAVRWLVSMLAYGLITGQLGLSELVNDWTGQRDSVALGAMYFSVLALVEATPLYPLIRGEWRGLRARASATR